MLFVENRELLDAFRRGERHALERAYEHFAPSITGFLRQGFSFDSGGRQCRYLGARSQFDLDDRLHDVFSRAFSENARLAYDGLSSYRTYLFVIARNLIIDDFRKKQHALLEYSMDAVDAAVEPAGGGTATDPIDGLFARSGDPRADAENAELLSLVEKFKSKLPPREHEIYRLRFVDNLGHDEIATQTGMSKSKIKTSEQRIRERFFDFMQSHGYFEGYVREGRGWLRLLRSWR